MQKWWCFNLCQFADKTKAEAFAKENGGTLAGFKEAWEVAKKDFSPAIMEKMKAKRALMIKKGEGVYKAKCKQAELPKFSSVADAKSYVKENNLCKDLKGKSLQVLGIYLFTKNRYKLLKKRVTDEKNCL